MLTFSADAVTVSNAASRSRRPKQPMQLWLNASHSLSTIPCLCPAMPSCPRPLAVAAARWCSGDSSSCTHPVCHCQPSVSPPSPVTTSGHGGSVHVLLGVWVRQYHPSNRLHMALHVMQIENLIQKFYLSWKNMFLTGRIHCGKDRKHEHRLIYCAICDSQ